MSAKTHEGTLRMFLFPNIEDENGDVRTTVELCQLLMGYIGRPQGLRLYRVPNGPDGKKLPWDACELLGTATSYSLSEEDGLTVIHVRYEAESAAADLYINRTIEHVGLLARDESIVHIVVTDGRREELPLKTWCKSCGDNYGDENNMLGRCCGDRLYEIPYTPTIMHSENRRKEALKSLLDSKNVTISEKGTREALEVIRENLSHCCGTTADNKNAAQNAVDYLFKILLA